MSNDLNPTETTPISDAVTTPATPNSGIYNEYGQIKNPDIAHDIANNEYAALNTEQRYNQELLANGLTEQEKINVEIGKMLYEKYPHAFSVGVDEKGQQIYSMKSTIQLAIKEPDYNSRNLQSELPGFGFPHRLFASQLKENKEDFSGLDPRIREILLHSLEKDDIAAIFSTKGIQYTEDNGLEMKAQIIDNPLLSLTKEDFLALDKILKHNEQLELRNMQAEKQPVGSLKELSALLKQ